MNSEADGTRVSHELRKRAEKISLNKAIEAHGKIQSLSAEEAHLMLHELQVHQIELELQNEELRRAQRELDESKARYFNLYDLAPVGYCTLSEKGLIREANLTAAGMLGENRERLIRMPFTSYILRDDQDVFYRMQRRLYQFRKPQQCELRMQGPSGKPFWARLEAVIQQETDGATVNRMTISDFTEYKIAEQELRESEEKYRTLYEDSGVAIGYYQLDGTVIAFNQLAAEYAGGLPLDFMGKPLDHVYDAAIARRYLERIKQAANADTKLEFEDQVSLPQGVKWFLNTFHKISDVDRRILGIQVLSHDITHLKDSERTLAKSKEAAEAANRAKSQFLANMSHEIRTPLNGLVGMLQLLEMTELTEEQKEYTYLAISSSHSLLTVINDILDYSKMEAGKIIMEKEAFSLHELLKEIEGLFQPSLRNKNLDLFVTIEEDLPELLVGDSFRVRQVLNNLIGNAVKFTFKGKIEVGVRRVEETDQTIKLEWAVRDTGIGVKQHKLKSIFSSFNQADNSTTRDYGGTGLGLSISNGLVELMQGEIWAESEEGVGSRFYFTTVMNKLQDDNGPEVENQPVEEAAEPAGETDQYQGMELLMVDDDNVSRKIIQKIADRRGWAITAAPNGQEAIKLCEQKRFDVIIMDAQMPVMDGYTATREIRKTEKVKGIHTPIIAMTAFALESDREKCLESGMDDYVSKPVDIELLISMIKAMAPKGLNESPDENQRNQTE
ncbi:MAG: response regulator [Bacillota bacterium]|nr:response regulator [Bacillota bacterium]MDW7677035.1 response regulator [Bacillota bacterium]